MYEEGEDGRPGFVSAWLFCGDQTADNDFQMTVAVHARYMGRPGRFPALKKFVEYIVGKVTFIALQY